MIKAKDSSGKTHIYASIAEAAKALHVDASNIGKVLRGARSTAGGWSFTRTSEAPTTRAGRAAVREKKISAGRRKLLNIVHDRLKEINVRFRNAKKEGVYASDPVLVKMMTHTDYFGVTKTGGYNISMQNLKKYDDTELNSLLQVLKTEEKTYVKLAEREADVQNAAAIAATFGISIDQVNGYEDILPALFDLLHLAKIDEFFRYADIQRSLYQAMQADATADELQDWIDAIYEAYWGNDIDALGSIVLTMQQYGQDDEFVDPY